jgi:hypothetical protein
MSTVKSETRNPVTDVSYFKPNKERDDVVTSLEEWAARLLKPDITDILKVAKSHWPSLSPLSLAISKSCCLGAARIVFNQLKQIMLTLFYFVWTVGGALIKAG